MCDILALRCASAPFLRIVLGAAISRVGRSARCEIIVDHPSVSRQHATLDTTGTGPGFTLTDLESRNGTFVDERQVTTCRVLPAQTVRFGCVAFTVAVEGLDGTDPDPETDNDGRDIAALPSSRAGSLSAAQRRVFDLLLCGNSNKSMARLLCLSPHTVHAHVRAVFRIFEVHSRAELLARLLPRHQV